MDEDWADEDSLWDRAMMTEERLERVGSTFRSPLRVIPHLYTNLFLAATSPVATILSAFRCDCIASCDQ